MAGEFCPKMLVDNKAANNARFAATTGGGTVRAWAVSNAATPALAWAPDWAAAAAVAVIHETKGPAAFAIAVGPDHPLVGSATLD